MDRLPSDIFFNLNLHVVNTYEENLAAAGGVAYNHLEPELALTPQMLSINALSPFANCDSPSRGVMMAGHFSQRMVTSESDTQIIQTGTSRELGLSTLKIRMPVDGKIVKVIPRYEVNHNVRDGFRFNPDYLIIYQPDKTTEFRSFWLPYRSQFHPIFGFEYKRTKEIEKLLSRSMQYIQKGTVFAQSPAIGPNDDYRYRLNFKTCFLSDPYGAEDGVQIWRGALNRAKVKFYERRTINCGSKLFPLPIHSREPDLSDARVFPEIGDFVPANGQLMALRPYGLHGSALGTSINDLRTVDYRHDTIIWTHQVDDNPKDGLKPEKLGRVVDVRVYRSQRAGGETPPFLTKQLERYWNATRRFHGEVVAAHDQITRDTEAKIRNGQAVFRDELHAEIVRSLAIVGEPLPARAGASRQIPVTLEASKRPLDEWRIDIVVEYEVTPDIGWKWTDEHGGKGTLTRIVENLEDMPRDSAGNYAEVRVDGTNLGGRMNMGRAQELYFNSVSRHIRDIYRKSMFNKDINDEWIDVTTMDVMSLPEPLVRDMYNAVTIFQEMMFAAGAKTYRDCNDYELICEMVADCLNTEVRINYPYKDRNEHLYQITHKVDKVFKPPFGPVTYRAFSGNMETTVQPARVGPLGWMLLDKVPREWNSVSTGTLQIFGLPSPLGREEKVTKPWRAAYTRVGSETEMRLWLSYGGRMLAIEIADRANNPDVMADIAYKQLTSERPSNIRYAVDRERNPIGGHRALKINNHIFACQGFSLEYKSINGFVVGHHEKHLQEFFKNED